MIKQRTPLFIVAVLILFSVPSSFKAASFLVSGDFSTIGRHYKNILDSGSGSDRFKSKSYILSRALLNPSVIIDDRFAIRSQWNLLTSHSASPTASPTVGASHSSWNQSQGGFIFGDQTIVPFRLNHVYLEWTTDFGVLKAGRMPVSWGTGLVYDAGKESWKHHQSVFDRLSYQLGMGNLTLGLAYSKKLKTSLISFSQDQSYYTVYAKYKNPSKDLEVGLMYERQARASGLESFLDGSGPVDRIQQIKSLGLSSQIAKIPFPLSSNLIDLYLKKEISSFTLGGEVAWLGGESIDYDGVNGADDLSGIAATAFVKYKSGRWSSFLQGAYISGDENLADGKMNGFVLSHPNFRPGLILGQEMVATSANVSVYANDVGTGSLTAYSTDPNMFSGVYYAHLGVNFDWSTRWAFGGELILPYKNKVLPTEEKDLGVEVDLSARYKLYKNCNFSGAFGYLLTGDGINLSHKNIYALSSQFTVQF